MQIHGRYFDGKTSQSLPAFIKVDATGVVVVCAGPERFETRLDRLKISDRIGNTARYIRFEDGGKFETDQNDEIDLALKEAGYAGNIIHLLESKFKIVALSLLIVVLFSWVFVQQGVPLIADYISRSLPFETSAYISQKTLDLMADRYFEDSLIDEAEQRNIKEMFFGYASNLNGEFDFELLFYNGKDVGANAFALPSGTIVITDQLLELSSNNHEVMAILLHEVGHVVGRHSMRHVIQNSLVGFLVLAITGDINTSSAYIATIPAVLIHLSYSREFEIEADNFALNNMEKNNIAPEHFYCILKKLKEQNKEIDYSMEILSTHPDTDNRMKRIKEEMVGRENIDCSK